VGGSGRACWLPGVCVWGGGVFEGLVACVCGGGGTDFAGVCAVWFAPLQCSHVPMTVLWERRVCGATLCGVLS
jgi:hypothetical protein